MGTASKSIKEWLDNFSTQAVSIWCEDPETNVEKIAGGVIEKSYLTYRILMKQFGRDVVGVRHRYSEFESLRVTLKDRYSTLGILVPSLPPKSYMAIVESPWLRNDSSFKTFMKSSSTLTPNYEVEIDNVGEMQLIAALQQLDMPYKFTMIQRLEDLKEEILLVEKQVKILLDKAKAIQLCEKNLQSANETFNSALKHWGDTESSGAIKSLAGLAFDEVESVIMLPHQSIASSISNTASLLSNKTEAQHEMPNYTGITLVAAFSHELANIESFKDLFKIHDELIASIDSCTSKLTKAEASNAGNKQTAKGDAMVGECKRILEERNACLVAFYKGFVYFTLPMFARQRANNFRRTCSALVAIYLTCGFSLQLACLDFFKGLKLNPATAISDTSRTLEMLSLKPLEQPPEDLIQLDVNSISNKVLGYTVCIDGLFDLALLTSTKDNGPRNTGNRIQQPQQTDSSNQSVAASQSAASINEAQSLQPSGSHRESLTSYVAASTEKPNPLAARRGSAIKSHSKPNLLTAGQEGNTSSTSTPTATPSSNPTEGSTPSVNSGYQPNVSQQAFNAPVRTATGSSLSEMIIGQTPANEKANPLASRRGSAVKKGSSTKTLGVSQKSIGSVDMTQSMDDNEEDGDDAKAVSVNNVDQIMESGGSSPHSTGIGLAQRAHIPSDKSKNILSDVLGVHETGAGRGRNINIWDNPSS